MYILIVGRGYPTDKWPLNGVFEFDQARALSEAGNKVVFAAIDLRSIRRWRKWGIEHFIKDSVDVYAINIPVGRVPHNVLRYFGQLGLRMLYRLIQKDHGDPDIVHAHFLNIAEIALTLKPMLNATKFVMTEHWSLIALSVSLYPLWVKKSAANIYASNDNVIVVSEYLAGIIHKNFGIDATCIGNMLDPIFLANYQHNRLHDSFEFVLVGSINHNKSPLECIQAFYDAFHESDFNIKHGQLIRLRLIGNGPLFHDCQECIKELGLENNVYMMGQLTRDKIKDILCSSDCFVLPSKLETFGVAYIEAMACGLPVIATKCGGPESFVDDTNGLLIPIEDEAALIEAFRYMVRNIRKYDRKSIASNARKRFSPQSVAEQLTALYKSL